MLLILWRQWGEEIHTKYNKPKSQGEIQLWVYCLTFLHTRLYRIFCLWNYYHLNLLFVHSQSDSGFISFSSSVSRQAGRPRNKWQIVSIQLSVWKNFRSCPKNIKQVGRAERDLESEAPETDLNILVNGENGHRINPTVTRFLRQQKVEQLTHSGGFIGYIFATAQRFLHVNKQCT